MTGYLLGPVRRAPVLLVLAFACMPVVWAACTEGPPASTPGGAARGGLSRAECERLYGEVVQAQMVVEDKGRDCSQHEDCGMVGFGFCGYALCPGAIAKTALPAFSREAARVEATACPAWSAGNCLENAPPAMPSCAFRASVCEQGRCAER